MATSVDVFNKNIPIFVLFPTFKSYWKTDIENLTGKSNCNFNQPPTDQPKQGSQQYLRSR